MVSSGRRKNGDFNLEWGAWAFPPPAYSPSQPPQGFPSEVSSTWSGRKFILSILILGIEPQYPHSPSPPPPELGPVCVQGSEVESLPRMALLPLPSFLHLPISHQLLLCPFCFSSASVGTWKPAHPAGKEILPAELWIMVSFGLCFYFLVGKGQYEGKEDGNTQINITIKAMPYVHPCLPALSLFM